MKFRTELPTIDFPEKISLNHPILTIGSCFSNTIGKKMTDNKQECLVNPFGTVYDPLSITRLLRMAIDDKQPDEATIVESDGVWKSLLLHSSFSGLSKDELSLKIKAKLMQVRKELKAAKWLMITFGTAFSYRHKELNQEVANCQKLPAKLFNKELVSHAALMKDFEEFYQKLMGFNPEISIILTVSPVRHIRDGLVENSVSKSILRILCNTLTRDLDGIYYYPSYELVQDDLRDYRYYEDDLIHPNNQANRYIWNHFSSSFFDTELRDFSKQWQAISASLKHRPFNPGTIEHQQFLKKLLIDLEALRDKVELNKEIDHVKDQILEVQ